ncbi:MAG: outer membrane beta-barrel protein [Verrucomicrobia bacterium]|nr:outer membrane beta-barrel protein [Verrucomicrobiota bacterium]
MNTAYRHVYWTGGLVVALTMGVASSGAQDLVLPTHEVPSPEVASAVLQREQARTGIVKWGPFDITPRVAASIYYDDNIETDATDEIEDLVFTLAPTISAAAIDMAEGMGKSMRLSYTPLFYLYLDEGGDLNRVDHAASIDGMLQGAKAMLGFSQRFRYTTDPVVDIGTRADRMAYDTTLRSRYPLSEKTSIEINGSLNLVDYIDDIYNSWWDLSNNDWISYQYSPKLAFGLGLVFGYTSIDNFPDQTYQQALGRVVYAVAEKVDVAVSAGGEWRQFKGGVDDSLTPVWNVTAAFRPRDSTSLTLTLFQQYQASAAFGDQSYVYTGVTLSARQMFMRRLALNLSGTYANSDYEATVQGVQSTRDDDLFLIRASLDFYIRPRWTAGVFYDFQTRNSTLASYEFDRNRVGLQTAWSY